MADISITAASVLAGSLPTIRREYNFGYATATAGQYVYLDSSNTWQKVDIDAAATGNGITDIRGITLNGGGIGQPAVVAVLDNDFTFGGTLTQGLVIYGSRTAGGITHDVPTSGAYPVIVGTAKSASKGILVPTSPGATV